MKNKNNSFNLRNSWWVLLFVSLCLFVYDQAAKKKKEEIAFLEKKLSHLNQEKETLLSQREDLKLRIASQKDPDWVELVLMKKLGVVPKGKLKVYFKKDPG